MNFVQFPNGKVWRNIDGRISGVVFVADEGPTVDSLLDAIAEAATGSEIGLSDFSFTSLGNSLYAFHGMAEIPEDEVDYAEEGFKVLHRTDPALATALAAQYRLSDIEVQHALQSLDNQYGQETILKIHNSNRQIHCPVHPEECNYVRIVVSGLEVAYWVVDEWAEDPASVMGAILGAANAY